MLLHHYMPTCTLRSTNQFFLDVPWFSTQFGKRLFSYLAATVWNGLSLNIRFSPTFDTFKSNAVWKLTFSNIRSTPLPCCHLVTASASDSVSRYKCMYNNNNNNNNKKLSCRRQTARHFVSLNMSQSHSRSFEMTPLSRACVSPY